MARLRKHLRLRSTRRRWLSTFVATLGGAWLVIEPGGLFLPDAFRWGWLGYGGLILVSALVSSYAARPRHTVVRALPPTDVKVTIRVGDLLAQAGNVVIGSNDTFDTQFDEDVISPGSIQGQLLTRIFGGDRAELDRQLAASLDGLPFERDQAKTFGKSDRYALGTVAIVRRGEACYFLPAFATMTSTHPAHVTSSAEHLQVALARTWERINAAGGRKPVHVPIIGSNLGRIGLSKTLLIQMIVLSFVAETRRGGPPALTVWVREDDVEDIDFAVLDEWLRGLCAA